MLKTVFIRSGYNYDMDAVAVEEGVDFSDDPSLAKQSFAEECDINTIVRRFGITGQLPVGVVAPTYLDFEDVFDYHTAMNAIAKAGEAFDAMPGEVRARFHNNPQEFLEFCANDSNREEAVKLGLVLPKVVELVGQPGAADPAPAVVVAPGAVAASQ